jgi:hypothetical protein
MVQLTADEVEDKVRRIMNGEVNADGVAQEFRERSKSRFPSLVELIDQGTNLSDYFSDHQSRIAQMMGVGVEQVDLVNDKRWAPVLGFADGEGAPRPMAVHEVERFIRGTDDYYKTPGGRQELSNNRLRLRSMMGVA